MLWVVEESVIERFNAAGIHSDAIRFEREIYTFHFDAAPAEFVATFEAAYGPTMNAFEAAERIGRAHELRGELAELFIQQNISTRADQTILPARYLKVSVSA